MLQCHNPIRLLTRWCMFFLGCVGYIANAIREIEKFAKYRKWVSDRGLLQIDNVK